jgi:hypothetical protein
MPIKSYTIMDKSAEDGRVYVVVTLDDNRTFGQLLTPDSQDSMDAQVTRAATAFEKPAMVAPLITVGSVRTKEQMLLSGIK